MGEKYFPLGGWVRKLRAVEDQSAPIPEERTSELGGREGGDLRCPVLRARGTRALRRASFDARSRGQSEATPWGGSNERAWKDQLYSHRRSESAMAWWTIFCLNEKGVKRGGLAKMFYAAARCAVRIVS